ncbi:MAG TPA: ATP-binding protein [Anaeromyxobacter sp.]|nr:ATP-binding protein [Anaeromyxobacter sp.]
MSDPLQAEHPLVYLTLRMMPPWVFIDELRRFVESFCACACPDANREAAMALAVHELMQNAVPHSHGEEVELRLEVDPVNDRVQVAVSNRCTDEEYDALSEKIARMNREPDALAHYLEAMRDTPTATRGGIGLARVRFEAQLQITLSRSTGSLTVHAAGKLRAPALQMPRGAIR